MMKDKTLNNAIHAWLLKKLYPQGRVITLYPVLLWECEFQPMPLSKNYRIRLSYKVGLTPQIKVIKCRLERGGSHILPHVYSSDEQSLCLHYPPERKWTSVMNIADTLIPWATEWLYHYEIWVVTGEWNGGGTVH